MFSILFEIYVFVFVFLSYAVVVVMKFILCKSKSIYFSKSLGFRVVTIIPI